MRDPTPSSPADHLDLPDFTPVPSASTRHDGWTPQCQRDFIAALAATGVVARAAHTVGKTARSAYKLRVRPGAESFVHAWEHALAQGHDHALDIAIDRAMNGYTTPRFYRGKQIGTVHRYDHRLLAAALLSQRPPGAQHSCEMARDAANFGNFEALLASLTDA